MKDACVLHAGRCGLLGTKPHKEESDYISLKQYFSISDRESRSEGTDLLLLSKVIPGEFL